MKNFIWSLIAAYAVYDILILILVWPVDLIKKSTPWSFGSFFCYFFNTFPILCNAGAALTLILMVGDRYRVIVKASNANQSKFRKILIYITIFMLSLCIACPDIIFTTYTTVHNQLMGSSTFTAKPIKACFVYLPHQALSKLQPWQIYFLTLYAILYILPLFIGTYLYYSIYFYLQHHSTSSNLTIEIDVQRQKKFLNMIFYLLIIQVICWTPEYIFYVLWYSQYLGQNAALYRKHLYIYLICQLFAVRKSAISPFLFAYFIPEFRKAFFFVFGFCSIRLKCYRNRSPSTDMINLTTTVSKSSVI
ncbi:Substance-K receptor [Trichoplax sp. H2]|nr:Substance-K receptor [Trichoplax sp. H2]|eukprot:RDD37909.1 Substance-K receptor [Trichoplax sp. H2]